MYYYINDTYDINVLYVNDTYYINDIYDINVFHINGINVLIPMTLAHYHKVT